MNSANLQETKKAQNLFVFLYLSNEQSEKETKKPIPFIIESKRITRNKFHQESTRIVH